MKYFLLIIGLLLIFTLPVSAQKKKATGGMKKHTVVATAPLPTVTKVDGDQLLSLFKRTGDNPKPLLVNFWATWCGPCVEEFPDLVKLNDDYAGKIDFITISIDDLSDIKREVPIFLRKTKAKMPAYLLASGDPSEIISKLDKDFNGGLPYTILFDAKGDVVYKREAKVIIPKLKSEIDKLLVK